MAKKNFSAAELRNRTNLSSKVSTNYDRIMETCVSLADKGATIANVEVDRDISDAIVRRLISNGFSASYNPNYGKVEISWESGSKVEKSAPVEKHKTNVPTTKTETAEKVQENAVKDTQTCNETKADETVEDKREAETDNTTAEINSSENKRGNGNVNIMRSIVFENCQFHITIPVDVNIPIDVHHFTIRNNKNIK